MTWLNYHVFYTDLDALLLDVVRDLLRANAERIDTAFFERHYAGGPHLRLRIRPAGQPGDDAARDALDADVRGAIEDYLDRHPSTPDPRYREDVAARLLEDEGDDPAAYDLRQRTNVLEVEPYTGLRKKVATDAAAELLEDYYAAIVPLVFDLLDADVSGRVDRRTNLIRIGFLHCLDMEGSYPEGSLSFKSHWQGYARDLAPAVASAIRARYEDNRGAIQQMMTGVETWFHAGDGQNDDPILAQWQAIETRFGRRALRLKAEGDDVFAPIETDGWTARRDVIYGDDRSGSFLRELYDTSDYLMSLNVDPAFTAARTAINLLYLFVPVLGLRPVDKCLLCYLVHAAIEDRFDCDLTDTLRAMKTVKAGPVQAAKPNA